MPNISQDQLSREILNQLQRYSGQIEEEIDQISKEQAKELMNDLKKGSKPYEDKTGDYSKGWRVKKQGKKYIVHNKTDYQLTHLLEKGHAKRGGGRVEAKIHIGPAEERAISAFLQKVERVIKG